MMIVGGASLVMLKLAKINTYKKTTEMPLSRNHDSFNRDNPPFYVGTIFCSYHSTEESMHPLVDKTPVSQLSQQGRLHPVLSQRCTPSLFFAMIWKENSF